MIMNDLEAIIGFRRKMSDVSFDGSVLKGNLTIEETHINLLSDFYERDLVVEIMPVYQGKIITNVQKLVIGSSYSIVLRINYRKQFYQNLDTFILNNLFMLPASDYYIFSEDLYSKENPKPKLISNISNIQVFIKILQDLALYSLENGAKLLFSLNEVLEIEVSFGIKETEYSLPEIDYLYKAFNDDKISTTERKAIFIHEIFSILKNKPKGITAFSYLLEKWPILYASYDASYNLYIQGFSVEKNKAEFDKEQLNLATKMHEVLSGIGAKILAIPASIFIVITQFDFSGINLSKNITILIGILIFSAFENILLKNHLSQLEAIEYNENELIDRYQKIESHIKESLKRLDLIKYSIRNKIRLIQYVLYFLIAVYFILIFYSCKSDHIFLADILSSQNILIIILAIAFTIIYILTKK